MAPLTRGRAENRTANQLMAEYYAQRVSAGLIITEATTISEEGSGYPNYPGIYNDEMTKAWSQVADSVHEAGGLIFMQLWHMGRTTHSCYQGGKLPVAPSAVKMDGEGVRTLQGRLPHEVPRPLEAAEIPRVVSSCSTQKPHIPPATALAPKEDIEGNLDERVDGPRVGRDP